MTPWHEYLMDVYVTCKVLVAGTCIPIGIMKMCVGLDVQDSKRVVKGFLLALLGLAIPMRLPTQVILIKLLEW